MVALKKQYDAEIAPKLKKEFAYESLMQVPRITKITLNMGVGETVADKKVINNALEDMTKISWEEHINKSAVEQHCIGIPLPAPIANGSIKNKT